jgi:hypothetical protein
VGESHLKGEVCALAVLTSLDKSHLARIVRFSFLAAAF